MLARFKASSGVPKAVRQRADFFVFFSETVFAQLAKYRPALVSAYRPLAGRPALEPVRLLAVLVLQFVERLPDRQAANWSAAMACVTPVIAASRKCGCKTI